MSSRDDISKDNATTLAQKENDLLHAEKSGSRQDIANTYISEIIKEKELKTLRQKDEDFKALIERFQSQLLRELDEIFGQINNKLDEFKVSRKLQNRMSMAEKNGDFDTLRLIFIQEYGMDSDKVNAMSEQALREQRIQFDGLEQQRQAVIISDIRELAKEYRDRANTLGEINPDLAEQELQKLDAIKYKAAAMGLDFEKVFDSSFQNDNSNLHSMTNEYEWMDTSGKLNTEFNKIAPEGSNPFNVPEKDLATIRSPLD